jgi:hypothetical protein
MAFILRQDHRLLIMGGVAQGRKVDADGNTIVDAPDIGAYEYIPLVKQPF